ncbi:Pyrimidine monooxygenase RutA, partial [Dissostichus eleginoides]
MEEWTSGLTSSFSSVFSQEDVVRILGVFENLGVGSAEDLKYVEADDLAKFLKPIEVYCEFNRVVGKNLKDNFLDALDRFSPSLMDLFRKKKGVTGQFLSELLRQTK